MAKSKKSLQSYEKAEDLNWEAEEGTKVPSAGFENIPDDCWLKQSLYEYWQQVDPEIRKNNPVWRWCLTDDHCSFVFRDGRKVTLPL